MPKIEITRTELVWPGKYDEDGNLVPSRRVSLPFQVIERVNETRATREQREEERAGHVATLFDYWRADEEQKADPGDGWRNKLIWGDNLYVMSSLLEHFAGQVDLVYIDPPFATGADFSFRTPIGEEDFELSKDQSLIEEKAYRDTWGRGLGSYLRMLQQRLILIRDLLKPTGSLYVHLDYHVGHYAKAVLDEVFSPGNFRAEIVWKRKDAQSFASGYGVIHDTILYYASSDEFTFNKVFLPLSDETADTWYRYEEVAETDVINRLGQQISAGTVRRYNKADISAPGDRAGTAAHYEWKGWFPPPGRHWSYIRDVMEQLECEGRLIYSSSGRVYEKRYLDESKGTPLQTLWIDISQLRGMSKRSRGSEWQGFETQKPEALLERIITVSSNQGDLVADFFCGSGTTLAVAEKSGRRWIGCDMSRFAIHTTRKRLMEIPDARPFEILNLGQYERQVWQGITFGGERQPRQMLIFEYLKFILNLYGAQPLAGTQHLHGKKGSAMVHVGAVDAPVTIDEINDCLAECRAMKQKELHVLGWEWEMGLANLMVDQAKAQGINLLLLAIPREVMEQQAVEKGDIHFYELAYLEVEIKPSRKKRSFRVTLTDFVIPNDELIPPEVREKIRKWSDYVDYWAVDWDFQNDTFVNGWTSYRTRRARTLQLKTDPYVYDAPGTYRILVKVIDIFGNDTSQVFEIEVK